MTKEIQIKTSEKRQLLNISAEIERIVADSGVKESICLVFIPHATAAVLLNEDEPGFKADMQTLLEKWIPEGAWQHNQVDNNATSHLASSLIGQTKAIPVREGELSLGTWQEVFLVELDGPRQRRVIVQIIDSNKK